MGRMNWFGGSIAEAVSLSKQRNAIFVVFVEGDNDLTVQMSEAIEDLEVVKRLSNENDFLAIKLKSGSDNYLHFVRIYQLVPVPSLFFIGRNGTPLEVVGGGILATNLAERIDRILKHHNESGTSSSGQVIKEQSANLIQSESSAPASASAPATASAPPLADIAEPRPETSSGVSQASKPNYSVVCDGDVCVRVPADGASGSGQQNREESQVPQPTESTLSMEDKMNKAKELIEARRLEKEAKEKELEKERELERRATGQGVAELRRWQAEQELRQMQEERKRERKENTLARQRILDQIAQDRAERKARDQPPPAQTNVATTRLTSTSGDADASRAAEASRARIQFKLPDGSSHTAHFNADDTLAHVQAYVSDNLQLSMSSFALWSAFPRRELTAAQAGDTLREAGLAPSAALLVLPRVGPGRARAVCRPQGLGGVLALISQWLTSLVFSPCRRLLEWMRGALPPTGPPAGAAGGARGPSLEPNIGGVRRRNNIHKLPGDHAGDDDNNTWNGNSTQQM